MLEMICALGGPPASMFASTLCMTMNRIVASGFGARRNPSARRGRGWSAACASGAAGRRTRERVATTAPVEDALVEHRGMGKTAAAQGIDDLAGGVVGAGAVRHHPGAVVGDALEL